MRSDVQIDHAGPTEIIPTQDNPEHLLHATSESFNTIINMRMSSKGHQADDQNFWANSSGIWALSIEKMAYMLKNTGTSKAVEENEDGSPYKLEKGIASLVKEDLLMAIRVEVRSAVGAAKTKMVRATVAGTSKDIFLDAYKAAEEKEQNQPTELKSMCSRV